MPDVAERPDVQTLDNFIGGRWVKARTTEFFDVHNPAVGSVIGRTPLSTAADVDAAVRAASQAFPAWRDTPVNARAQVLYKFKALLEQHFEELARTVTTEHGKTLDEARGSVRRGIECVEVACGAPSLMQGFGLEDISAGIDVANTPAASSDSLAVRLRPTSPPTPRSVKPKPSCSGVPNSTETKPAGMAAGVLTPAAADHWRRDSLLCRRLKAASGSAKTNRFFPAVAHRFRSHRHCSRRRIGYWLGGRRYLRMVQGTESGCGQDVSRPRNRPEYPGYF